MFLNCEPPIDPPCERYHYAQCPSCKEHFVYFDEVYGQDSHTCYAWWDNSEENPICSKECCDEVEDEFGFEWEEELDSATLIKLKRLKNEENI